MGQLDATTRGALEVYQADRGLEATGEPNRATWASLLYDVTNNRRDREPYTWVSVSESLPETLDVHRGHRVVFSTPVNTGVPGAETELGIFPIYARYVSTTMSGTDVDGTKYVVPDVPWVNYFNGGDAVHGYPRASYGFPQSNGCVELPIEAAHTVFGMLADRRHRRGQRLRTWPGRRQAGLQPQRSGFDSHQVHVPPEGRTASRAVRLSSVLVHWTAEFAATGCSCG